MNSFVCIVCPRGCHIEENDGKITGAFCKRGEQFVKEEMTAPKRSVTTTVATAFKSMPVLPVRTDGEVPKDKIFDVMKCVDKIIVSDKVKMGDVIAENIADTSVNIIACSSIF